MFSLFQTKDLRKSLTELDDMLEDIDRSFSSIDYRLRSQSDQEYSVKDEDSQLTLELSVPGHSKKTVSVTLDKPYLTILAKPLEDSSKLAKDHYFKFKLTSTVDPNTISAEVENGILKITLLKIKEKPTNSIKVEVK